MIHKILVVTLFSLVAAFSNLSVVQAKSPAAVKIEYSVPKNIQAGTEVTTTIRFVAMTDIPLLAVSASPYEGVTLVSGGQAAEFTNLKRGDIREIDVTINLAAELGYLAVYATSTDTMSRARTKTTAIRYGKPGTATSQKLKSPHYTELKDGEKRILMQAEDR